MITLHESNITSFPLDNGIGVLSDAIKAFAEEELNGMFEFEMEYDSEGFLVDELKEERIIKAKAQDKLGYQLFRIYSITKSHENDNLIIKGQHITYDNAGNFIEELIANNMTKKQVMELIGSSTVEPHPFNITSSNNTTRSSTKLYRTNPLQMIAGMDGSVLQIWGGQIERDNFHLILHDRRGHDDGVKVTYEKNITGLTGTVDISGLVTRIYPFVYLEDENRLITVTGKYIDSPFINNYEKIYIEPIDYSHDERIDLDGSDAQIRTQLTSAANEYFNETDNDRPKAMLNVEFAHLWETEEYKDVKVLELVGMGDGVTVNHSKLKVDATAIVNYIRYDCIAHVNEEVKLGNVKARFSDSINKIDAIEKKVNEAESTVNKVLIAVDGKTKIFYGPDEPTEGMSPGDLWFKEIDGNVHRTYRFDGIEWQLIVDADSQEAKADAQQAKADAEQAVTNANLATQNAITAIEDAQVAFDKSLEALDGLTTLFEFKDETTDSIANIKGDVQGLQTTVSKKVDESTFSTFVQQTNNSLAGKISMTDAEGVFVKGTEFTATIDGLQTTVSNKADKSTVTQLAGVVDTKISTVDANNRFATQSQLTQTSNSLTSTITRVDAIEGWDIASNNLLQDSRNLSATNILSSGNSTYEVLTDSRGIEYIRTTQDVVGNYGYIWLDNAPFLLDDMQTEVNYNISADILVPEGVEFRFGMRNHASAGNETHYHWFVGTGKWTRYSVTAEYFNPYTRILVLWGGVRGGSGPIQISIRDFKYAIGNKESDWSPSWDQTQSQISQLSDNINLRVMKNDIINQINISTESILISGKKLILDGDTTVNGTFRVSNANITSVDAGKMTTGTLNAANVNIINMNASNITTGALQAIDIYGVTIRGSTIYVDGDKPDFLYSNAIDTNPNTRGTHIYIRPTENGEVIATKTMTTDTFVPFRGEGIYGNFLNINTRGDTSATHLYVRPLSSGEVRITANETTDLYRDLRARELKVNKVIYNSQQGTSPHLYLGAPGEIRVVENSNNSVFKEIRARGFYGTFLDLMAESSGSHIYVRPAGDPGELRVTVRGTTNTYRPVRASAFPTGSSEKVKENIVEFTKNALDIINQSKIYKYNRIDHESDELGFIIERETPSCLLFDSESINGYSHSSLNTKAIQELTVITSDLDVKIDETREELVMKIADLENRINELESAA